MAILTDDLGTMVRSWIIWIWFAVTAVAGVLAVIISTAFTDPTSFILAWGMALYLALGSFVVIIVTATAASSELAYLGDALISRSLTPIQYVLAKLASRLFTILTLFLVVVVPVAVALFIQLDDNDLTTKGIILGTSYVSLLLGLLCFFGVTLSTIVSNGLVAMALAMMTWYLGVGGYALTQARSFSPEGVLGQLPPILRGSFVMVDNWPIVGAMVGLMVLMALISILIFSKQDI